MEYEKYIKFLFRYLSGIGLFSSIHLDITIYVARGFVDYEYLFTVFAFVIYLYYICAVDLTPLILNCNQNKPTNNPNVNYMKDRIELIMQNENLTSAQFADRLQINRAVISHILNGRNNPSLDVVTKILSEMDYISSDWLLNGKGEMYKQGTAREGVSAHNVDLFTQSVVNEPRNTEKPEKTIETAVKQPLNVHNVIDSKPVEVVKVVDKKVTQVIIYYSDNTFEVFRA